MSKMCGSRLSRALACAILAMSAAGGVRAAEIAWNGAEDSWFNAANWGGEAVPVEGDVLDFSSGKAIIAEGEAVSGEIRLGYTGGGSATLEMTGGTLTIPSGMFQIGYSADATGAFTLSGGDVTLAAKMRVGRHGRALFEMTGGTFTLSQDVEVPAYADATATMRVLGGTFTQTYGWINLGLVAGSAGTLEVGDGGTVETAMRLYLGRTDTSAGYVTLRTGGTIAATHVNGSALATFTFDGGTLKALENAPATDPLLTVPATITANGATVDTQAFDVEIAVSLSGAGGLTKLGTGTLALTGANAYAGNTVISAGTLLVSTSAALPGFDQPGRITVADGARIIAGSGWTADDIAALKANVTYLGEGEFTVGTEYNTASGDLTIADDLTLVDGFTKAGANMLKLTGKNTFGRAPVVMDGTLQADFGQGLDAAQGVVLQGGTLSSDTGTLTATLGTGPGEVNVSGGVGGFTARGTPLTAGLADLAEGGTYAFGTDAFPFTSLILNGADADATLTWTTPLDVNGTDLATTLRTDAATTIFAAALVDTPLTGYLHKAGAGDLVLTGDVVQNRMYSDAGNTIFSNNTVQANYIKANAANGRIDVVNATLNMADGDGFNISNGSTARFLPGTTANINTFSTPNGTCSLEDGVTLELSTKFYGYNGSFEQLGGDVALTFTKEECHIGKDKGNAYTYTLNDGTFSAGGTISVGHNAGTGTFVQNGGSLTGSTYMFFGHKAASWGYGTFTGGKTTLPSEATGTFAAGYDSNGFVTLADQAEVDVNYLVWIGRNNTVTSGVVRLNGGRLSTPQVRGTDKGAGAGGANRALIFNGGTLRAKPITDAKGKYVIKDGTFIRELTHLWMTEGGGTIDTDGNDVTIAQPITDHNSLAHRWSFTDGSLTDEVTGKTGTVSGYYQNEALTISLAGGANGHSILDLGANLLPAIDEPFTVEIWAKNNTVQSHSRIFDIGASDNNYLMLNWSNGTDTSKLKFELRHDGTTSNTNNCLGGIGLGKEYHITFTAEPNADGRWVFTAYKRYATGELRSTASFMADAGWTPTHLLQNHFYLGHSQFTNDNDADATYNEVRIWNRVLTPEEQQASVALGPDLLPEIRTLTAKADLKPFIKAGAGTLTLTGANTYAAPTRVAAGTLALAEGATLPPGGDAIVDAEATLDLNGRDTDFGRLAGTGLVANGGALTTTDGIYPGDDDGLGTLTVNATALTGTLHVSGGEAGACSCLAFASTAEEPEPLDLANLALEIDDFDSLVSGSVYTILDAPRGLAGHFSATNLEGSHWTIQVSGTRVTLRKPGFSIILR